MVQPGRQGLVLRERGERELPPHAQQAEQVEAILRAAAEENRQTARLKNKGTDK